MPIDSFDASRYPVELYLFRSTATNSTLFSQKYQRSVYDCDNGLNNNNNARWTLRVSAPGRLLKHWMTFRPKDSAFLVKLDRRLESYWVEVEVCSSVYAPALSRTMPGVPW